MKKGLLILLLAILAGVSAFWIARSHRQASAADSEVLLDSMPELAWLREDLKLSDDQFAKASEVHAAYRPVCAGMCRRISEAHAKLKTLASADRGMSPELQAAILHHARVHAECQQKMLEHLYQTAGLLDDKQAARYLETMIPHALDASLTGNTQSCHKD
ncbi:MAG: hypothetical protein Q8Q59_02675 [Luteolibacter sp.]|jgi:hypothetical protein|nr:hypothetical protein [Luteolibacter sp.]